MATFESDYGLIDAFANTTGWSFSDWEPTLNNSASNNPNYIEGAACAFWPLSKGVTGGYASHSGNSQAMNNNKILVGNLIQLNADITLIPITTLQLRIGSNTALSTNAAQWDAKDQLLNPLNVPISGHVPIIGHEQTATTVAGTPVFSTISNVGFWGTTGNSADGKQGWFDFLYVISYVGLASHDYSAGGFFDALYDYCYDNNTGNGVPSENDRPLAIFSKSGSSYKSNVSIQFASASGDTALTVVETGKVVQFANVHADHNLGYIFKDPVTGDLDVRMTDITHFWSIEQGTTGEIFTDPANATDFQWDGCSWTGGGDISLPADTVNRWVRNCKFTNCQAGSASDGECTNTIFSGCKLTMTISGDADFTGSQFLAPQVAADGSAVTWTGNFDPDGNLDNAAFSKGTNAHHAIEFGTATPTTMTLRNIDFSGFSATDAANDSTLYIRRTSGTVTINLIGCTGNISYKSSGATVNLVSGAVTVKVTATDPTGTPIQNVRVLLRASDGTGPFPFEETVTIANAGTTATVTHTSHGMATGDYVQIFGGSLPANEGVFQITVTGVNTYTYTMNSTPGASPTGTIEATFAALYGLTDVNGEISVSRSYSLDQPVEGWGRKSSSSPYYKEGVLTGTVDDVNGFNGTAIMALDE